MKKLLLHTVFSIFLISIFFISTGTTLYAMDWPMPSAKLVNNFGENIDGIPCLGDTFSGDGIITSCGSGEVLFYKNNKNNENNNSAQFPSPFGTWIALDHNDGLISIYAHLDDVKNDSAYIVSDKTIVAQTGRSGAYSPSVMENEKGFYFSFFDRKEKRYVNTQKLLSAFPDSTPPVINQIILRSTQNTQAAPISISNVRNIQQGRYSINIDADDLLDINYGKKLAPYRIDIALNGAQSGSLILETFGARDGSMMLYRNGLVETKQVYRYHPSFEVGEIWLSRGLVTFDVSTEDIAGNSRTMTYRLIIE